MMLILPSFVRKPRSRSLANLSEVAFDLGFITNPKNGEVKALSVRVPCLDVFCNCTGDYFVYTFIIRIQIVLPGTFTTVES